jgi:adenylate cyclase
MTFKVLVPMANMEPTPIAATKDASDMVEITDDTAGTARPNVSLSIKLSDMSKTLGAPGPADSRGTKLGSLKEGVYDMDDDSDDSSSALDMSTSGRSWGIKLFTQIGNALLSSPDLDSMLGAILELVFSNVPAQRGLICMCTPSGQLQPVAVRTLDDRVQPKVKISLSIANEAIQSESSLLVADVSSDQRFSDQHSIKMLNIMSAMCVPLYREGHVDGLIYVDTQSREQPFGADHLDVLTALSLFSAVAIEQGRLRDEIVAEQKKRESLSRYHSPAVVDQILARSDTQSDGFIAEEQEVSVLFADLCGFTSMSEKLSPTDVVRLLNTVFELLSEAVFHYKGTLDKFMGDGMLAFFGAPIPQKNHAERAVRAALKMQEDLVKYNASLPKGAPRIGMRVGINSGPVVVGDIGSKNRKDYTVIGGTVNLASRLESSVAKPGQVVLGPKTHELVKHSVACERLDPVPLKGINAPVTTFLAVEMQGGRDTQSLSVDGDDF